MFLLVDRRLKLMFPQWDANLIMQHLQYRESRSFLINIYTSFLFSKTCNNLTASVCVQYIMWNTSHTVVWETTWDVAVAECKHAKGL